VIGSGEIRVIALKLALGDNQPAALAAIIVSQENVVKRAKRDMSE